MTASLAGSPREPRFDDIFKMLSKPESARYTLRRCYVDIFYLSELPHLQRGSRVLDLGGVRKNVMPGRFDISRYELDVTTLNILVEANPHVIARGEALPFPAGTFDAVICSEVLEHVRDPRVVLREIARVLRPAGRLLMTVPFLYHIHASPHDYARYTDFFWAHVLDEAGFAEISIKRHGLYWSVLMDFFFLPLDKAAAATRSRVKRKLFRAIQQWPLSWLRRWAVRRDERLDEPPHPVYAMYTTGYGVKAQLKGNLA